MQWIVTSNVSVDKYFSLILSGDFPHILAGSRESVGTCLWPYLRDLGSLSPHLSQMHISCIVVKYLQMFVSSHFSWYGSSHIVLWFEKILNIWIISVDSQIHHGRVRFIVRVKNIVDYLQLKLTPINVGFLLID